MTNDLCDHRRPISSEDSPSEALDLKNGGYASDIGCWNELVDANAMFFFQDQLIEDGQHSFAIAVHAPQ